MARCAVILAGGYSTRFDGGDKAVAEVEGKPMIRHVVDRLAECCDELVVNCRSDQVVSIRNALTEFAGTIEFAEDPEPGLGPVAGILAGSRAADSEFAAVVACDMPYVSSDLIRRLFDRAPGHDAVIPRRNGWLQTTQAVYDVTSMADACEQTLACDERAVTDATEKLERIRVLSEDDVRQITDVRSFVNINTREELDRANPSGG